MDWGDVATWCATGVAVASAVISVWWPWHNRPQADWTFLRYENRPESPIADAVPGLFVWLEERGEPEPSFICELRNSGDGTAFEVEVRGNGCTAYFLRVHEDRGHEVFLMPSLVASIETSDRLYVIGFCDEGAKNISIRLSWTRQPTRLQRRVWREYRVAGSLPKQPRQPIREKRPRQVSMLRWKFEHSPLGLWLHRRFPSLPLATLKAPPET